MNSKQHSKAIKSIFAPAVVKPATMFFIWTKSDPRDGRRLSKIKS